MNLFRSEKLLKGNRSQGAEETPRSPNCAGGGGKTGNY